MGSMKRIAVILLAAGLLSGCGGSGASEEQVNVPEMERAVDTIVSRCIDESFEEATGGSNTKIRLAVDDLIRNFEEAPDAQIDMGGKKMATPREALETVVTFLENEGISGEPCDAAAADQIHAALASR
jgi:hypothetical protein